MPTYLLKSALKLSVEERLRLVREILDSTVAAQEATPSTQTASMMGIRRAQALVRLYIHEGSCLSDELVEER